MKDLPIMLMLLALMPFAEAFADGRGHLTEGDVALEKNQPGPAIVHFTQAIESGDLTDAEFRDAYWKRAVANFDKNLDDLHIDHSDRIDGFEDCLADLESARGYGKEVDAAFNLKGGQCREYVGLKEEAITYYIKVLDQEATDMERGLSLYSLGLLHRDLGAAEKAAAYFETCASEADPASRIAKGCKRELQKLAAGN